MQYRRAAHHICGIVYELQGWGTACRVHVPLGRAHGATASDSLDHHRIFDLKFYINETGTCGLSLQLRDPAECLLLICVLMLAVLPAVPRWIPRGALVRKLSCDCRDDQHGARGRRGVCAREQHGQPGARGWHGRHGWHGGPQALEAGQSTLQQQADGDSVNHGPLCIVCGPLAAAADGFAQWSGPHDGQHGRWRGDQGSLLTCPFALEYSPFSLLYKTMQGFIHP